MRYIIFLATAVGLGILTSAAQTGTPLEQGVSWLEVLDRHGVSVVLVLGGAALIAFKVWPKLSDAADKIVMSVQNIDKQMAIFAQRPCLIDKDKKDA